MLSPITPIRDRFASGPPILLDGPTGTELERRGVDTAVPQWSAAALVAAPEVVSRIHCDYVAAGAELLTANTFRTHALNLAAVGWQDRADELTRLAARLAREAAQEATRPVWVAGSIAPLGDCYTPTTDLLSADFEREHRRMAESLARAGVDAILVETHPILQEAVAAARAALDTGLPTLVSLVCTPDGRLLSGERLGDAAAELARLPIALLSVNCVVADAIGGLLAVLRKSTPRTALGAYGNIGGFDPIRGWVNTRAADPEAYAELAADWLAAGLRMVGGCCGTTPAHLERLRRLLDRGSTAG